MARFYPDYGERLESLVVSKAECRIYNALHAALPAEFLVFHSVSWIAKRRGHCAQDGETDFVIVHPELGIVVIEAKGGGIRFDAQLARWSSRDSAGTIHEIRDPFEQAKNAKYRLLEILREHTHWDAVVRGRITIGHAAWFPDVQQVQPFVGPDRPREIILTADDLMRPAESIRRVFGFYKNGDEQVVPLRAAGVELVITCLARSFSVPASAAARIREEEALRVELTERQFELLRFLGSRRRVGISGGVGTGKTLMALTKARELARQGFRTLLLCFNRPLGDHLASLVRDESLITAGSFHAFCHGLLSKYAEGQYLGVAKASYPGGSEEHLFNVQMPAALCLLLEKHEVKFDAIIVDEAQDFADEYWLPIEFLLADAGQSPLYLFYDPNQALYRRPRSFPIKPNEEFALTQNCRNTAAIHSVVQRYYRGSDLLPPTIAGAPVRWHPCSQRSDQLKVIRQIINATVIEGKVPADEVVLLLGNRRTLADYERLLEKESLPGKLGYTFGAAKAGDRIRVVSAAKFKGLEAAVAILWGLDEINIELDTMDLYVGLSRPRNELHVVGAPSTLDKIRAADDSATH